MNRKLSWLFTAILLVAIPRADAQQAKTVPLIGFLEGASISESQGIEPFLKGLRDLGYIDRKNIIVEIRAIEGKPERIPDSVAEFLRRKVDVIFSAFGAGAAAKQATTTVPIVFVTPDPVGAGLVNSLARPGANVTGLASLGAVVVGKRLEIIKDTLPKLNRVAVFWNPTAGGDKLHLKELEVTAKSLSVNLQAIEVRGPEDFENAFKTVVSGRAGALIPLRSPMLVNHRKQFLKLVDEHRMPTIYDDRNFVEPGGLMSYGTDRADLYRRAASYLDKILKGSKPADLPVEQPTKFELVINLKTAKQIGLTIPPNVLARADKVIR